jgi:hypothetical protein
MRGWIQSEVPKSTTIISALVVGLSQPGRSLPQVVVSFRQLPPAGQYELTRLACPLLMISRKGAIRFYASQNHSPGQMKEYRMGMTCTERVTSWDAFASLHMIVSLRFSSAVASSFVATGTGSSQAVTALLYILLPKPSPLLCFRSRI